MRDDHAIEPQTNASSAECQLHAVLVRVFDTGVLLIGESGIGKSECALDLVTRGHRLAADDAVEIFVEEQKLVGRAPGITRHLLEIRGLGIIDVPDVFGESASCDKSAIDLCIELRRLIEDQPLENVLAEYEVVRVKIPKFVLPVSVGRNLATLVETAVRLHEKGRTFQAAERLIEEHASLLRSTK